jgi:hypothetical protein
MKDVAMLSLSIQRLLPTAQASAFSEGVAFYAVSLGGSPYRFGGTSPESGPVKVASLSDRYWHECFDGARRVEASGPARPSDAAPE